MGSVDYDFEKLYANDEARSVLRSYLRSIYSAEILGFLESVDLLRVMIATGEAPESSAVQSAIQSIVDKYVRLSAPEELNIDTELRTSVLDKYERKTTESTNDGKVSKCRTYGPEMFDRLYKHIRCTLFSDVMPVFVRSDQWTKYVRNAKRKSSSIFRGIMDQSLSDLVFRVLCSVDFERPSVLRSDFLAAEQLMRDSSSWRLMYQSTMAKRKVKENGVQYQMYAYSTTSSVINRTLASYYYQQNDGDELTIKPVKMTLFKFVFYLPCSAELALKLTVSPDLFKLGKFSPDEVVDYVPAEKDSTGSGDAQNAGSMGCSILHCTQSLHTMLLSEREFVLCIAGMYDAVKSQYVTLYKSCLHDRFPVSESKLLRAIQFASSTVDRISSNSCRVSLLICANVGGWLKNTGDNNLFQATIMKNLAKVNRNNYITVLEKYTKGSSTTRAEADIAGQSSFGTLGPSDLMQHFDGVQDPYLFFQSLRENTLLW